LTADTAMRRRLEIGAAAIKVKLLFPEVCC